MVGRWCSPWTKYIPLETAYGRNHPLGTVPEPWECMGFPLNMVVGSNLLAPDGILSNGEAPIRVSLVSKPWLSYSVD